MNPRSMPFIREVEGAAEEVHRHIRRACGLADAGDYKRARSEAELAQGMARKLKELLGDAAEQAKQAAPRQTRAVGRRTSP
jgi:hypothetical protein